MAVSRTNTPEALLEETKSKTLEQLAIDRHHLLIKMPFIGSLLMRLDLVPVRDDRVNTAATNGDCIFVDVDFYTTLSPEERQFVLAHETWHCALLHFMRCQGRDHVLFNYAADLEIHFILTREGLRAPFVLPHNPAWKGLSAEEIYTRLKENSKQCAKMAKSGESAGTDSDAVVGAGLGNGVESGHIKNVRQGGGFDTHLAKGDMETEGSGQDASETEGFVVDGAFSPEIPPGAAERCRERLTATVQQFRRLKGDAPLGAEDVINKILEPKISWKELLSQFVTSCYGGSRQWLPPNRRYIWKGLYMQGARQSRLNAVVAVDTSGSTMGDLPRFFSELGALLNTFGSYQMTVIHCDAKVQKVEEYDDFSPFPPGYNWVAKGGGGTDFRPVFKYIDDHAEITPDLLIYLTDGYGDYPERAPAYPVLWMVAPRGEISVPWGLQCPFENEEDGA